MNATTNDVTKAPSFFMTCFAETGPIVSAGVISLAPDSSCSRLPFVTNKFPSSFRISGPKKFCLRQPGDLGVLSESRPWLLGGSEDPWLSIPVFRRIGFFGIDSDLSIVPTCHIGSGSPMSALGHKRSFTAILPECLLAGVKRPFNRRIFRNQI